MRYADACCEVVSVGSHYIVKGKDVFTGSDVTVKIPSEELFNYRKGMMIQDAMPSLTCDEREFLISGMSESFPDWAEGSGEDEDQ